jgi:hypothetical protein
MRVGMFSVGRGHQLEAKGTFSDEKSSFVIKKERVVLVEQLACVRHDCRQFGVQSVEKSAICFRVVNTKKRVELRDSLRVNDDVAL